MWRVSLVMGGIVQPCKCNHPQIHTHMDTPQSYRRDKNKINILIQTGVKIKDKTDKR